MKFKIGDKVKVVRNESSSNNPVGSIGVVSEAYTKGVYRVNVEGINTGNLHIESDLELYGSEKPQTFSITGKSHQLESFGQDLLDLGYVKGNCYDYYKTTHSIHSNINGMNGIELKDFVVITGVTHGNICKDKSFTLPDQYSEALQFCKDQLEIAKEYFKEELVLEDGKWYVTDGELSKSILKYKDVRNAAGAYLSYQKHNNGSISTGEESNNYTCREKIKRQATTSEVQEALLYIANRKGFRNVVFNTLTYDLTDQYENTIYGDSSNKWFKVTNYPDITVNGYKAVFEKEGLNFNNGCAKISKYMFMNLYDLSRNTLWGNKSITSVKIGAGKFTVDQIKQIAEYYLNQKQ